MKIRFLGATGTVTGSRYLVGDGAPVLIDCGLFQGYKQLRLRNWAPPPFDPAGVHAAILTHAHIDHSGYLPLLVKRGFRGRVYCSDATRALCRILLPDSAHLQEEEARHANRFGYSKHAPALPLYTREDAQAALALLAPVPFDRAWQPAPGLRATLRPAGHILGASMVELDSDGVRCVFSGDLGRPDDPIMRAPAVPERADALVLESTYGDRRHPALDTGEELAAIVSRTAARGGVVVVPAFAVGRAQALLLLLLRLKEAGRIPAALPLYVDSPMATDVTAAYVAHRDEHRLDEGECRALAGAARFVATPDESRALDASSWPAVIIAGSGMATGGRVLHHLERFGPDARNTILLTGFQAGGTRGDALARGAAEVKIHGAYVPIRAEVRSLETLSAHADWPEILDWLARWPSLPRRIFLTHGEPAAVDALRRRIAGRFGLECEVPDYLQAARVES
jgi:metallo-beta-lactamase family protein